MGFSLIFFNLMVNVTVKVLSARDVLLPCSRDAFNELYVLTPLMQSDLHKIIVSSQILTKPWITYKTSNLYTNCLYGPYVPDIHMYTYVYSEVNNVDP